MEVAMFESTGGYSPVLGSKEEEQEPEKPVLGPKPEWWGFERLPKGYYTNRHHGDVDLGLRDSEEYIASYKLPEVEIKKAYFSITHIGEGDGLDFR